MRLFSFLLMMLFVICSSLSAAVLSPHQALRLQNPDQLTAWAGRYEHGESVERSIYWAIRLYCKAANKGHAQAQYALGWLYANGRGIARDDPLAAAWFRRAAKQGHPQATRMLGLTGARGKRRSTRCKLPAQLGQQFAGKVSVRETRQIHQWVEELAPEFGLEPKLVLAVISAESGFDRNARSAKNAQGLMQLIPETADRFGVSDPFDPQQNIRGGMAYLRWLLNQFDGDVRLALAGYNAGEQAVAKYQGVPPYNETQNYVAKIMKVYPKRYHPPDVRRSEAVQE